LCFPASWPPPRPWSHSYPGKCLRRRKDGRRERRRNGVGMVQPETARSRGAMVHATLAAWAHTTEGAATNLLSQPILAADPQFHRCTAERAAKCHRGRIRELCFRECGGVRACRQPISQACAACPCAARTHLDRGTQYVYQVPEPTAKLYGAQTASGPGPRLRTPAERVKLARRRRLSASLAEPVRSRWAVTRQTASTVGIHSHEHSIQHGAGNSTGTAGSSIARSVSHRARIRTRGRANVQCRCKARVALSST
jgi:hypothetical protein